MNLYARLRLSVAVLISMEKHESHMILVCRLDSNLSGERRISQMAERKSALKRAPKRPHLEELIERSKRTPVTDEELRDQRASFVYGNAPKGSRITKESRKKSVTRIRVTQLSAG
jgi:hypothetical protein